MLDPEPKILSIQFNQDQGCFALGTENGFSIWNSEPVTEICRRDIGGIKHVCMLQRSSILALVGGGRNPFDSPNKVILWNDVDGNSLCHMEFRLPVLAVRRRNTTIAIATLNKVYIYEFNDVSRNRFVPPVLVDTVDTTENPSGLLCLSYNSSSLRTTLAFPAYTIGHAYIMGIRAQVKPTHRTGYSFQNNPNPDSSNISNFSSSSGGSHHPTSTTTPINNHGSATTSTPTAEPTTSKSKPMVSVKAHKSALAFLTLSGSGKLLATVSKVGTLIRVFDVESCLQVYSFRRGIASADVDVINFNRNETMLLGVFDQSLYLFKMTKGTNNNNNNNNSRKHTVHHQHSADNDRDGSLLSLAEQYLPKFEQTTSRSFAQIHIPSEHSICTFQNDKTSLLAVSSNGTARKYRFQNSNIQMSEFHKLLKENGDSILQLLKNPEQETKP